MKRALRIVIDLQACQSANCATTLQLVRGLIAEPGHEIVVALSNRFAGSVEPLLARLAPLARERVRVFDLPAPDRHTSSPWRRRACELIRANFLATLGADAVLVFHGPDIVCGQPGAADPYATIVMHQGATDAQAVLRRIDAAVAVRRLPPMARPRLACVAPLPPERSGIADYCAALVPVLARHYDVELVTAQSATDDPRLADFPLRSLAWFEANGHQFDRVLYHMGNSPLHRHMFALMGRHPGVVVLHDFFISGVLDHAENNGSPHAFMHALYDSHGYTGLLEHLRSGRNRAIWQYPVNRGVLDAAAGIIVHADFSADLARAWYGVDAADGWHTIPLLRERVDASERGAARARLGLADDDYLVCSFGMLGPTKLNDELLDAWRASPLAGDPRCTLVLVGENDHGPYGAALLRKIAGAAGRRIRITGFATPAGYADYLCACDCAVQLRTDTRGETSASILDCLLYGVPTIVNAHGAVAALAADMLCTLPDVFCSDQLGAALTQLRGDPRARAALSQRARAYMQHRHAPEHVGTLYARAIEHEAVHGRASHYRRLVDGLARIPGPAAPSGADLAACAVAIAANQGPVTGRQLLVDVSAVIDADLKTGIQRVVRSVLLALIENPPPGWRVEPVFSTGANRPYHYARRFGLQFIGERGLALEDAPVDLHPGDMFLGLDLFTNGTAQNEDLLQSMREHGVQIYFVIYDLLPVLRPDAFPFGTEQYFGDYLRTVARVSDGLVCISRSVSEDLAAWIRRDGIERIAPLNIGWFHLGADIDASAPSMGLPDNAATVLSAVAARPSLLMVGTLEPRKGHTQALDAFEALWERGANINLVIVGKQGWMVERLVGRLHAHPELGRRLFWLPGVSDQMLLKLYAICAALLAASDAEGFGLPLIEAAQHGVAIIARDIPVFREVAGPYAYYFSGSAPRQLADAIDAWLALHEQGTAPRSAGMPWLTWKEATRQLLDAVERQRWSTQLPGLPPDRASMTA